MRNVRIRPGCTAGASEQAEGRSVGPGAGRVRRAGNGRLFHGAVEAGEERPAVGEEPALGGAVRVCANGAARFERFSGAAVLEDA